MPTKTKRTRGSRSKALAPTLGPLVCAWIERWLVHGEGDFLGQPFTLRPWQKRLIYRAYELNADGSRRYHRALFGFPKGQGKTELGAALGIAELAGPTAFDGWQNGKPRGGPRLSPDIPVAAASYDQADLLFSTASRMIREGPLADYFEVYETEILPKDRAGRMYKVAAVAGTNDGRKPTFFLADELHEWTGKKERVHLVLSNCRAKRRDSWELAITTAGWDSYSLLGQMYEHGKRVRAGKVKDPTFLFEWLEASEDWDLTDPEQLEAAIREANPAAGDFLDFDQVRRRYHESPEFEFRRYHLNQFTAAPERWLPDEWDAQARPERTVEPGTPIVLGFDGAYNRDSTALLGCTIEETPHLFVVGAWERPAQANDWTVDKGEVVGAIEGAVATYDVQRFGFDDTFGRIWSVDFQALEAKGVPVEEWNTRAHSRMGPACGQLYGAVKDGRVTHPGDERLNAHFANTIAKPTSHGLVLTKDHKNSERHIDLAVAAVIAFDLAVRRQEPVARWVPVE